MPDRLSGPRAVIRALLGPPWRALTPLGRAALFVGAFAWLVQRSLGWLEFGLVALLAGCVFGLALLLLWLPQPARVRLAVHPQRITAGERAGVEVLVEARGIPLLSPLLRVDVAGGTRLLRLPLVPPGGRRLERLDLPVLPRGVHLIGPVVHERTDPLGLVRRRRLEAAREELLVRPRLTALPALDPGLISDLDGVPSNHPASSDLAFHALREYVPGDDLRHVHWRSSAKADSLLVRQYVETRRSLAMVVLDDDAAAYASEEEFETAVSVVASIAVRALRDDFEVDLVCGSVHVASRSPEVLLDACCRVGTGAGDLRKSSRRAAATGGASSLVAVVSGGLRDPGVLRAAGSQFGADAVRLLVRTDLGRRSAIGTAPGFKPVVVGRLEDLPAVLTGSGVAT